jgi:3alpha(or 20beta)-hydroxysteroid dehydrogenase
MMGVHDGKVAIVTGAASGMGAAHARRLVAEGARVLIGDIQEEKGRAFVEELGSNARFHRLDVSSEESWNEIVEYADSEFGKVTLLVNNAGVELAKSLLDTTAADFDRTIAVNHKSTFFGMKAVVPGMIEEGSGSIVNIGAGGSVIGYENMGVYQSSKSALSALTKTAAIEFGKYGIRVNVLHPGIVQTPMLADAMEASPALKNTLNESVRIQALPRMGDVSELAGAASFLLSDDAGFITGVELLVDGGLVLGKATPLE